MKRVSYTAEFKAEAVKQVIERAIQFGSGYFDLPESSISDD